MAARGKPRVGISACLLGEPVRWDGTHRRDAPLLRALGPRVAWVPVCPELELGLGVPRAPIRLVGRPDSPRLVEERSGRDWTAGMRALADRRIEELLALGLDGWVTKARSPSCGLRRVAVHPAGGGAPARRGAGAFVRALRARLPRLPIEDEVRLADPAVRRRFLAKVAAHRAARQGAARRERRPG